MPETETQPHTSQVCKRVLKLMGNRFEISVVGDDEEPANQHIDAAVEEIRRIEKLLTTFDPSSQTNQINQYAGDRPVKVDQEVFDLISRSKIISRLTQGAFDIPLSFVLSNFENKFYQPFNQFGISPKYKWATLHLGYRNLTYSNYTLAGHRILGAGFDLKPKNFRIGFMYGQLRRSASIDSSMNANPMYVRPAPSLQSVMS